MSSRLPNTEGDSKLDEGATAIEAATASEVQPVAPASVEPTSEATEETPASPSVDKIAAVNVEGLPVEDQVFFVPTDHKSEARHERRGLLSRSRRKRTHHHHHHHSRERHRRHGLHPVLIALIVLLSGILVCAVAAGITVAVAINQGEAKLHQDFDPNASTISTADVKVQEEGEVVEWHGQTWRYNPNIVSFVVIGHDNHPDYGGRTLADTIVLVTLDTKTNKARATMVPRNTWCLVDQYADDGSFVSTEHRQITLSHSYNFSTKEKCATNTVKSVARVFYSMPIKYYFDFGEDVVAEVATAVGGVDLEALEYVPGVAEYEGQSLHLEGRDAYTYVQYRDVDVDESALDRQERQVQFIRALAAKVSKLGPSGLLRLYQSVSDKTVTNLGMSEVAYLLSCLATGDNAQLEMTSLRGETTLGPGDNGVVLERYHLNEDNVTENTLAAFYERLS